MDLDQMQDLMNNLEVYFKVLVCPLSKDIVLRVFHERNDNITDIIFDMQGHLIEDSPDSPGGEGG